VLDVGGGTGTAAFLASHAMGRESTVVVVDSSFGMLRIARRKGLAVVADTVPGGPFPDGMFDRVMANFVLSYVACNRTALSDMVRVLRPGGWLGLTTWGTDHSECRKL